LFLMIEKKSYKIEIFIICNTDNKKNIK